MAGEAEFHDDNTPPPPPPVTPTQQALTLCQLLNSLFRRMGNGPVQVLTDTNGQIKVLPPKTAKEILARERERQSKNHLAYGYTRRPFSKVEMINLKECRKYIFKQQFESFSVSNSEGLHKGYNRFQSLLSQLEIHGASVSNEDANQKFLKSLPTSWSQLYCIILPANRNMDPEMWHLFLLKALTILMMLVLLMVFLLLLAITYKKKDLHHTLMNSRRKLQFDAKEPVGFDKTKVECFNCHNTGHFARECRSKGNQESRRRDAGNTGYKAKDNGRRPGKQEEPKALVTIDGDGVDWTGHAEDEQENFALMAYSNSGSNTEVTSCSKECEESYAKLKKLYDEQREQLGDASIEIQAYTQALKKVEAQLVCHQQNQLVYEEKIRFMKIDLDDKTNVLTYHKKLLAEAVKEKEELKTKLENFQSSSKGLSKLLNSQMSTKDKSRLGYGDQIHEGVLSYENEVLESVFDSRSSDVEDSHVYDKFAKVEGMHAVPPPMTGIYTPPESDFGIDESNFTYGPKQSKTSESAANTSDSVSCESNSSVETLESVPKPAVNEPKAVSKPKVWSDAPIIEEYEETVKEQNTCSPSLRADKRDWNGLMSKKLGLGYGFTKKACFVCGSFSHLIRDCDFHEKRMAKQVELNKKKGKGTGQGENRPVWNNVQRLNHQNKFVPKAVLTKTNIFPINTARQNLSSQATTTSSARKINTARPIVNKIRPRINTAGDKTVSAIGDNRETDVKASSCCNWRSKRHYWNKVSKYNSGSNSSKNVNSKDPLGRPKHMTGNKAYLVEYQEYIGGPVAFGGSKGQITGKVLFTDFECLVMSHDFELPDENQVLLRVPRQNNMYSFNLENIVHTGGLAYLIAKATVDESNKWHRRLGHPVTAENKANKTAGPKEANHSTRTQDNIDAGNSEMEAEPAQEYFASDAAEAFRKEFSQCIEDLILQAGAARATSTNTVDTVSTPISTTSPSRVFSTRGPDLTNNDQDDSQIPALEDIYDNPSDGILPMHLMMMRIEPNKISQALEDDSWVDAIQEDLLQFKIQKVWILVDLPFGKKAIGTKWVYRNKKDERGVVVRNKARLVAQGYRHEQRIDYNEVFAPMARIEAIRIFLAFASYMVIIVYQMGCDECFLYGTIDAGGSRYRKGTIDKNLFIKKNKNDIMLVQVYVDDIIFGSTKKSWCDEFEALMKSRF
ncbi:ribonuclease H-like domain-containing protein [Tanacetum coccineum]